MLEKTRSAGGARDLRRIAMLATMGTLLLGTACRENNPESPTVLHVPGSYRATTFTVTTALGADNILQSGGSLSAAFDPAGSVRGHATIPRKAVDKDFAGTWKITKGQVKIDGVPSDIFIQDLSFQVAGNRLVADETFGGSRVQVVLAKQ